MKYGMFGQFGGQFVPDTLMSNLTRLDEEYTKTKKNQKFWKEFGSLTRSFSGRPTPLFFAESLSKYFKKHIYLKREDLNHTGSHKINNCIGQALLAKRLKKKRIIAETGAGQHGVATATVCSMFGFSCVIYMGEEDVRRQALNVYRMRLLGSEVRPVRGSSGTLKDAINEALRDWIANPDDTYYLLGSCVGPHPYPTMVRDFQSIIGKETREQMRLAEGRLPEAVVACVGGGSNSIGIFHPFVNEKVKLYGVEAFGSASLSRGRPGILHGAMSYLLQDKNGQVAPTYSIAAGLDYPGVGPEHSFLKSAGRVKYGAVRDKEALDGFRLLSKLEGIIPALEPAHAIAYLRHVPENLVVVNLSGRGDKDVQLVQGLENSR